jgi:cyclopropane fatty-acyl-phospholipid synthase-like methyltransferase
LARAPADADGLTKRLGLHERGARDFFDALVALGMLERNGSHYSNTPATDLFLDRNKPSYVGGILEMANARLYGFWGSLTEALKTGQLQNEAKHGGDLFGTLYANPDRLRGFLKAMTGISMGSARAIAERFPWQKYRTFVDIGCAEGAVPVALAQAHPQLTGGGFDLPPVKPHFEAFVAAQGLSDRLRFHPGDFFKDELPQVDVIVMGHILHDWNLEQKQALLAKVYKALPKGGAVLVYDAIIDDDRRQNAFGLLMSLNMLIETTGGFDYTGADCMSWMRAAGFSETRVEPLLGPDSMVIGIK